MLTFVTPQLKTQNSSKLYLIKSQLDFTAAAAAAAALLDAAPQHMEHRYPPEE
jgi:hypothetical protein